MFPQSTPDARSKATEFARTPIINKNAVYCYINFKTYKNIHENTYDIAQESSAYVAESRFCSSKAPKPSDVTLVGPESLEVVPDPLL